MIFIEVGKVKKTYGVDGQLRFYIKKAFEEDFLDVEVLFLEEKGQKIPYFIEEINAESDPIVKLEDVNSKETAAKLSNTEVFLRKSDLKKVDLESLAIADEFLYLKGFQVKDETYGFVGEIMDILEMPFQVMSVVLFQDREVYIPLNEDLIKTIDAEKRIIEMMLPEGLLDL